MFKFVELATENGRTATKSLTKDEQKSLGQFLTPPSIARFMAQRCVVGVSGDYIHVLEPAAGAGILAAAAVEALLIREDRPSKIKVTLCELDDRLLPALKALAAEMRSAAIDRGVTLSVTIRHGDFLLSNEAIKQHPVADIIIANPPYFKLGAKDPRSIAHAYAVYGQPNIYGLFMAACASLVKPGGQWCFITPRSWTNGSYFRAARRHLLDHLSLDAVHVFGSREDHFHDDDILQEAMITWASRRNETRQDVVISASDGVRDLDAATLRRVPASDVVGGDEQVLTLNTDEANLLPVWHNNLDTYGLKVSTGPVVAFRAIEFVKESKGRNTVPLLWLQHVGHMKIQWPIKKKREHIKAIAGNAWMLVPNTPMVILRRFSPKEDARRVTAAAYTQGLPGAVLGLENHLNYIYRPGGLVTSEEALGLAAYLNSVHVDRYIRAVAGSTQVNAAELRKLPLPPLETLLQIGRICRDGMSLVEVDAAVESVLKINNAVENIA